MVIVKVASCNCDNCIKMCMRRPCRGTPKQIRKILLNHPELSSKFIYDKLTFGGSLYAISPNMKNNDEQYMSASKTGECIFLEDNLCMIHKDKPIEGSLTGCYDDALHGKDYDIFYKKLFNLWNSKEGCMVIELYSKLSYNPLPLSK